MSIRIDLKKFIWITISFFIFLTLMSIRLIPFNYPTASWLQVLYWQIRDQLFIRHNYFFIFLFISVILGMLFSLKCNGICKKIQKITFWLLILMWIWIMYFESSVA
jgi:hypothetical protein